MKVSNIVLLLALIPVIISCKDPKVEAIGDYVQTIGNSKTELGFKKKEFKFIGYFTGLDSARAIWQSYLSDDFNPDSNYIQRYYELYKDSYERFIGYFKDADSLYNVALKEYATNLYFSEESFKGFEENLKDARKQMNEKESEMILWEGRNRKYNHYINIKDSVLYDAYMIKYKIKNPFLNAVQEVNDTFYFIHGSDVIGFN